MTYQEIIYQPGKVARIILNRPQYLNAQSWRLLEELDAAFHAAVDDAQVGAIVVSGAGGHFSSGHDLSTPEDRQYRQQIGKAGRSSRERYENIKEINLTNTLRWRNLPKPTIAMVEGYCIFGGWMIAAAMDILFAHEDAQFLPGQVQYFSVPWDVGVKRAKEILFEHRYMSADECFAAGFVNRVFDSSNLESETLAYAERVADNFLADPMLIETHKRTLNRMQDTLGFTHEIESSFDSYVTISDMASRGVNISKKGGYARTDVAKKNFSDSRRYVDQSAQTKDHAEG